MEGVYKYDDCTVTDPVVNIYDIGWNYDAAETVCEVNMQDAEDGATFTFSDPTQPVAWTDEEILIWVENYLQRYKQ